MASINSMSYGVPPLHFGDRQFLAAMLAQEMRWRGQPAPQPDENLQTIEEPVFLPAPVFEHSSPRLGEIIAGIQTLNLPLKLYRGEAKHLDTKANPESLEIWKLSNGQGFDFQFVIQEGKGKPHENYGEIHAIWLLADVKIQGNFWQLQRFWRQVADLLLEHCGYSSIWGRAIWSANSQIRALHEPDYEADWRWLPTFAGWDAKLQPIIYQGLVLMYLRMGFILHPNRTNENLVIYMSRAKGKEIITLNGQDAYDELTQHSLTRRREWFAIQKKRAALVSQPKVIIDAAIVHERNRLIGAQNAHNNLWTPTLDRRRGFSLLPF